MGLTTIVIPVHNELRYTQFCLSSILAFTPPDSFEIIVIDNASTDGTGEYLENVPYVNLVRFDRNQGVAPAWNEGMRQARGDSVLFVNNDVVMPPGWLENMRNASELAGGVCVCPSVSRFDMDEDWFDRAYEISKATPELEPLEHITGFCFFVDARTLEDVGEFDEQFTMGFYEDTDFSMRLHKYGKGPVRVSNVLVHHFESRTLMKRREMFAVTAATNWVKWCQKWGKMIPLFTAEPSFSGHMRRLDAVKPPEADWFYSRLEQMRIQAAGEREHAD